MKRVDINHNDLDYDEYKRFHVKLHSGRGDGTKYDFAAVLFENHEFMWLRCNARPEYRRPVRYKQQELGIEIVGSTDDSCLQRYKFKTPDGDAIPITYLNRRGMIDMLVDEDTGVAVSIAYSGIAASGQKHREQNERFIPHPLRSHAQVYISGPGEPPVSKAPITIYPTRQVDKAHRAHVQGLVAASKVWFAMQGDDIKHKVFHTDKTVDVFDPALSVDFGELEPDIRQRLVHFGTHTPHEEIVLPYLTV